MRRHLSALLLCLVGLCLAGQSLVGGGVVHAAPSDRTLTIALVLDGVQTRTERFSETVKKEIVDLLATDATIEFTVYAGDFTSAGAKGAVDKGLADRKAKLVLTLGVLTSHDLASRKRLSKPSVAAIVIDPKLQGIPFRRGASGRRNLAYLSWSWSPTRDLTTFKELVGFKHVAMLADTTFLEAVPSLRKRITEDVANIAPDMPIISMGSDVKATLAAIPDGVDAIYLGPLPQLGPEAFSELAQGLLERRIASFSLIGRLEVEQGILMSTAQSTNIQRLGRKLAIYVQRLLIFREDAADLSVAYTRGQRLTINMATANAIGFHPSWAALTEADLIRSAAKRQAAEKFTIQTAVKRAVAENLDLAASELGLQSGAQEIRLARSSLLPQVSLGLAGQWIDADRAQLAGPERVLSLQGEVSQVVYSEAAWANLDVQKALQKARTFEQAGVVLDTIRASGIAYLNVVRAKTLERINTENLKRTRSNLELAQTRQRVGVGTMADVYRFEAELANGRIDVISANAQRNVSEIEFNRLLNRPLEASFSTFEASVQDSGLVIDPRLSKALDDPWSFRIFREFIAEEGLRRSPELAQLDASIVAQERLVKARDRAYWIPSIAASFSVTQLLAKGGNGSTSNPALPLPTTDDTIWTAQLALSLPLFEGTKRYAEAEQARLGLRQIQTQRVAALQRIEQRVRASVHQLGFRAAAIRLSAAAATAASQNLKIVTESYAQGAVGIPTLLDAQNSALVSEQVSANAVADFLVAVLEAYRAVGAYPFLSSQVDQDRFVERFESRLEAARAAENRPSDGR
ncbi:MAG: outer membrane protein [Myxococcota bacterium]|jgi:outer membrane protein